MKYIHIYIYTHKYGLRFRSLWWPIAILPSACLRVPIQCLLNNSFIASSQNKPVFYENPRKVFISDQVNKIECPLGRQPPRHSRHLAPLFPALQLILSKCKLKGKKMCQMASEQGRILGLVEDLNQFYWNVGGIIEKHSETIVISFQPVTFIIIIPLFRHANFLTPVNHCGCGDVTSHTGVWV